jgi:hypothetical protein
MPSGATAEQRVRYVGHAGDFVFLLDPNKDVVAIVKFETGKSLLLGRFPAKAGGIIKPSASSTPASASVASAPLVAPASKP